jgi:hypothetical protein
MAVYIYIWKSAETELHAEYTFSPEDGVVGIMRIERATGNMDLLQPCPGDESNAWYQCACKAVWNGWAVGRLPEVTQYIYGA